jgi:glutamine amidotransferase-like uncharacterized protein
MNSSLIRKIALAIISASLLFVSLIFTTGCCETDDPIPRSELKIAIYYEEGAGMWEGSALAVKAALESVLSRDVDILNTSELNENINEYLLVIIAGCEDPNQVAYTLGENGMSRIRSLVADGGGFIGIGGGAYFAGDSFIYEGLENQTSLLNLYTGHTQGPIVALGSYDLYGFTTINIENSDYNPDLLNNLTMLYRNGPTWIIDNDTNYESVATYSIVNNDAAVQFEYGIGRVALIAVHPEIEEQDPNYNGGLEYSQDDPESDWFLIQTLSKWCLGHF